MNGLKTLVLLCQRLNSLGNGLELAEVCRWLPERDPGVQVEVVADLCHRPGELSRVAASGALRLVLGLCSGDYDELEMQFHARKAGLDPLGVGIVNLGAYCALGHPRPQGTHTANVLLAAAVARARAFPGSKPQNVRPHLLRSHQKLSRRALFTLPPVAYMTVPTMNAGRCSAGEGCDQCVRACPWGALARDGAAILVNRARCQGCGLCVACCPQRAVEFPGGSPEEIEAQVSALLEAEADLESPALLFVCKDAPTPAGDGWLPVRVPCIAAVPVAALLQGLARGARAVALGPCRESCPMGEGEAVRGQVAYCQQLLGLLGDAPERVQPLSTQDTLAPPPALPPSPGEIAPGPIALFGREAAARAVMALAGRYGAGDLVLEHPSSPLGIVEVNAQACTVCGTCATRCPTGALSCQRQEGHAALVFDASLCSACGECVAVCPEGAAGAIIVARTTSLHRLSQGPQVLLRDEETRCERCGAPVATSRVLRRIATLLGDDYKPQLIERLCIRCRGVPFA